MAAYHCISTAEAIARYAERNGKPYSLIIADEPVAQPAASRFAMDVSERLSAFRAPVILLHSPCWRCQRAMYPASTHLLAKPLKESELIRILDRILNRVIPAECSQTVPKALPNLQLGLDVLLVEDNPVNQKVASRLIEKQGCRVTLASNGHEAVSLHRSRSFDIIFMDVQMPEMNGFEATRFIRAAEEGTGSHVPIIALTANAMAGDREICLEAGMDDHLPKPINPERLVSALNRTAAPG